MIGYCLLFILWLSVCPLLGQSKNETISFIINEMKSCENDQLELRDIDFSDNGNLCKIRVSMLNQFSEKSIELSLKDVDIYSVTKIIRLGVDEQVYVYSLVASPRGRNGAIRRNMTTIMGMEVILHNIPNAHKVNCIELAFRHLTELITGKPKVFKTQSTS
jgi:hypothetical protein